MEIACRTCDHIQEESWKKMSTLYFICVEHIHDVDNGVPGWNSVEPKLDEGLDLFRTISKVFWPEGVADRTRVRIISFKVTSVGRL